MKLYESVAQNPDQPASVLVRPYAEFYTLGILKGGSPDCVSGMKCCTLSAQLESSLTLLFGYIVADRQLAPFFKLLSKSNLVFHTTRMCFNKHHWGRGARIRAILRI